MTKQIFRNKIAHTLAIFGAVLLFIGTTAGTEAAPAEEYELEIPLGLDEDGFHVPEDNPLTKAKVELGRFLYFDKRMSKDNTISCSTCHIPALAFTDGQPVSAGIHKQQGGRSAPTSINRGFSKVQFWDGRAATLEEQSVGPLTNPIEHGFPDNADVVARINKIEGYTTLFKEAFGIDTITIKHVGKAIASFQRTLISGNSPFDKFDYDGEEGAISESAKRGKKLFFGKARCNLCHFGTNFSDEKFHNIGIGWGGETVDIGRYHVTHDQKDIGAFKTPTLREISRTAPYMHDGRFATLADVVEHYNGGGVKNPFQDNQVIPLNLTDSEKQDLVAMLRTLNGEGWQHATVPLSFPK
ncbi:MAG: c-type cytochrome [Nitrospina sp.]|jgi:cytochrome c peroxidase|nr:c-type cytochrome [Nitrospina sp.]